MNKAIEIYESPEGTVQLDVQLEKETVWLTQFQMTQLFDKNKRTISEHIRNIFKEKELEELAVVRNFRTTANDGKKYAINHYNLDVIISVGYRVKSHRGVQFRQWATRMLKNHLIQGYTLNQQRIEILGADMGQLMDLMQRTLNQHELANSEGLQLTQLIGDYARSWTLLQAYDSQNLPEPEAETDQFQSLGEKEALSAIKQLKAELLKRGEASELFGRLMSNGLDSSLGAIEQTFDSIPLYPSINSRAAHLLYFVVKNHAFTDGNKRIGSFLFLLYLQRNQASMKTDGTPKITDNAMVPLALLIAESDPKQKELVIRLVQHLLDGGEK